MALADDRFPFPAGAHASCGPTNQRATWTLRNRAVLIYLPKFVKENLSHVKKGSKIYIEGRLQTSSWEDKQSGEKKYKTEIVASDLVLLSGRGEGGGDHEGRSSRGASASFDQRTSHSEEHAPASAEITDEDIPF